MVSKKNFSLSVDELEQALELTDKKEIGEQRKMLQGIIRFGDETVTDIMTSRLDMVMLDVNAPYSEVLRCAAEKHINTALDVASREPVSKNIILKTFSSKFGLKYGSTDSFSETSPNGSINIYVPTVDLAEKMLNWKAVCSSIETLLSETVVILDNYGKA